MDNFCRFIKFHVCFLINSKYSKYYVYVTERIKIVKVSQSKNNSVFALDVNTYFTHKDFIMILITQLSSISFIFQTNRENKQ